MGISAASTDGILVSYKTKNFFNETEVRWKVHPWPITCYFLSCSWL